MERSSKIVSPIKLTPKAVKTENINSGCFENFIAYPGLSLTVLAGGQLVLIVGQNALN